MVRTNKRFGGIGMKITYICNECGGSDHCTATVSGKITPKGCPFYPIDHKPKWRIKE